MPLPAILGALVLAWGCAAAPAREPPRVILFVADGAGVTQWSAGYLAADSMGRKLAVAEFPVMGLLDPGGLGSAIKVMLLTKGLGEAPFPAFALKPEDRESYATLRG